MWSWLRSQGLEAFEEWCAQEGWYMEDLGCDYGNRRVHFDMVSWSEPSPSFSDVAPGPRRMA